MKEKQVRVEKARLGLVVVILAAVVATLALYAMGAMKDGFDMGAVLLLAIALIIILIFVLLVRRMSRDIKEGMPMHDEMSKRVVEKAGYTTYLISIYILLGIGIFEETISKAIGQEPLEVHTATGMAILLMALVFALSWAYHSKKGVPQ